ncbi:hypothetical protein [[Kitasatospora] papulosa]|uniref:hypothetical protein n=1 Tax=[Kitasatospora] papulosa TaxID=1464011 RepID=UPI003674958A
MTTHIPSYQLDDHKFLGFAASVLLGLNREDSPIDAKINNELNMLPMHAHFLESVIGAPDLYAGGLTGMQIAWRRGPRTLGLTADRTETRLTLRTRPPLCSAGASSLERADDGASSDPDYLWKVELHPTRAAVTGEPSATWEQFEASLGALLRVWAWQLPLLFGSEETTECAFNLVNHADGGRLLVVLQSKYDGLLIMLGDRPGTAVQSDHETVKTMTDRGWDRLIPLLNAWEAWFEPSPASATAAARLVVSELRHRGATSPGDISLSDPSRSEHGYLSLPGLAVSHKEVCR